MPKLSKDQLLRYFTSAGSLYPLYQESVDLYTELKVHAEGIFPEKLLAERRPSESAEIMTYRRKTYQPVTKLPISKVISSFGKIRRSPDWCIDFPAKASTKIIDTETLAEYCNKNLPGFGSIENWVFNVLLKNNLIDANALIAVVPINKIDKTTYAQPVPILFNSDHVIQYDEKEKYCILKSKRKVNYIDAQGQYVLGDRFWYIDDKEVIIFEQDKGGYSPIYQQKNITGQMPVWKVKGDILHQFDNMALNQSRLHAMVPFLNKAACSDNDLDGSKIQHLYPLFWYIQDKSCNTCSGLGKIPKTEGAPETCSSCSGSGKVAFTPFSHLAISPAKLGEQQTPIPGAGFVERDTKILDLQEKLVEKNNLKALSAINMQFLDQTPLSISGDAKQVDREELNNTVYTVAEDIIYSVEKALYFINEWRYSFLITDAVKRQSQLPNIATPQNFDLLPSEYLIDEITKARNNKVNPFLLATLEQQLAEKKFYNEPELLDTMKLFFDLDPLTGMDSDAKMTALSNKGITPEDYVISNYAPQFIKRALIDDPKFTEKTYDQQMAVLQKYAKEKMSSIDTAASMIDEQKKKILAEMKNKPQPQPGGGV